MRAQHAVAEAKGREAALQEPLVQAVLDSFPGAKLVARRPRQGGAEDEGAGAEAVADDSETGDETP